MDKLKTSNGGGGIKSKKGGDKEPITKHYPWLETFDNEAKASLTAPEVTIGHVLKLITLLEGHVSPEVSKLKTRPNRATKFLTQIRKRISIVKMGGLMIESDEMNFFPTYALLMTHIVNISLISSKLERFGAQWLAKELYYFLKLMFEGENEYVLDVALCSTLDEHANSTEKVGFQLFSYIVEDWRLYSDSHASQMKFCAICSVLAEGCLSGQQIVDKNLSTEKIDKNFLQYLRRTLYDEIEFGGGNTKKFQSLKGVIRHIKPTSVKSISRSRLVVVSKRDITGGRREHSGSSDDSSSSTVNMPGNSQSGINQREISSSGSGSQQEDPVNQFLGQLGLGVGFFLDTDGREDDGSAINKNYYDSNIDDYMSQNDHVSSSSTHRQSSSSHNAEIKEEQMDVSEEEDEDSDGEEKLILNIYSNKKTFSYSSPSPERRDGPTSPKKSPATSSRIRFSSGEISDDSEVATNRHSPRHRLSRGRLISEEDEEEETSDRELSDRSMDEGNRNLMAESDEEDNENEGSSNKLVSKIEEDSDLEVVSVVGDVDAASMNSDDSRSRDEEEAESGEDVVPNYDVDSDIEDENKKSPIADKVVESASPHPMENTENNEGQENFANVTTSTSCATDCEEVTNKEESQANISDDDASLKSGGDSDNHDEKAVPNEEVSPSSTSRKRAPSPDTKECEESTPTPPKQGRPTRARMSARNTMAVKVKSATKPKPKVKTVKSTPSIPVTRGRPQRATSGPGPKAVAVPAPSPAAAVRRSSRLKK